MPSLPPFPPDVDFKTVPILEKLAQASALLGELKGTVQTLPNPNILLNTLVLQEALASSEIENIVTTQDEAFRAALPMDKMPAAAKEVSRYREAMMFGYDAWRENRFISENMLIGMYRLLKQRSDGYRTLPGTVLRNDSSGEVVHTPPQDSGEIIALMRALEAFINDDSPDRLHPLINMALIHHQFESIHPFSDGNGRIGRILNVLYLTHAGLLDAPILYLSRAINRSRPQYYRLLQAAGRADSADSGGAWQQWVIYLLGAVESTAAEAITLVKTIRALMTTCKHRMRKELPKVYSQELLNNLFRHPYTRAEYVTADVQVKEQTARKYLDTLARHGFVSKQKSGRNSYYINTPLVNLLLDPPQEQPPA